MRITGVSGKGFVDGLAFGRYLGYPTIKLIDVNMLAERLQPFRARGAGAIDAASHGLVAQIVEHALISRGVSQAITMY